MWAALSLGVPRLALRDSSAEPTVASHVAVESVQAREATWMGRAFAPNNMQEGRTGETMGFFSKDIKTMDDLFAHTLRDIYYAEKQIVQALPEMIDKAADPQLK